VRVGVRANHVLNNWTPRDVQLNTDSPVFGSYFNPVFRRLNVVVEAAK
jgi:hypothetical protein